MDTGSDDVADDPTNPEDRAALEAAAVRSVVQLLVDGGPLSIEDLGDAFGQGEPQLSESLLAGRAAAQLGELLAAIMRQTDEFWRLPDGRLAAVLHHLRRATFTHRLTADELARQAIDLSPDLIALALPRAVTLQDGTAVRTAGSHEDPRAVDEGSLLGPDGWLAGFTAGGLVAVGYDGTTASLAPLDDRAADEGASRTTGQALRQVFDGIRSDRAPEVHRLVIDTLGLHPAAFAEPVAPINELLAAAGLSVREAWVGPADRRWSTPPEDARRQRLEELLVGADGCCATAARRALGGWHDWLEALPATGAPSLAATDAERLTDHVDHGPVAAMLAEVATLGRPLLSIVRLGQWAGALETAQATATAGTGYLRALGAAADSDPLAAEAHLDAALAVAPNHPACLGLLAELAEDRGDATRSVALRQQAGRPPAPEAQRELAPFLTPTGVGRNEPCPCGSGRKFKQCCARQPQLRPLVERMRWLLSKAARHAIRSDPFAVQSLRNLFDASSGGAEAAAIVGDMILFGNRGLARYLDGRGALLPADELACATAWLDCPMRLLEVVSVDDGGLEVVDLADGGALRVVDRAAAEVPPGESVLARPLPVGEVSLLSSALLRIPTTGRARALEAVEGELRPFELLQLLVDLQVDALRI